MLIPKENITPDLNQPRKTFDLETLVELRNSMGNRGPDQPLVVRPVGDGKYMIVTGERRWRACDDNEIECIVRDINDREARLMQYRENMHRDNLSPLELGGSFRDFRKKYGVTQQALAREMGITTAVVSRYESMFLNLFEPVKGMLRSKEITSDAAYYLSTIPNSERQLEVSAEVTRGSFGIDQTRQIISDAKKHPLRPITEIVQKVRKEDESSQINKAVSVIPQPERREETRMAIEAYDVNSRLAPKIAEVVIRQPGRPVQEIVEEVQEAEGASRRSSAASTADAVIHLCAMVTRQMEMMSGRLTELKSLPVDGAEEFLTELQKLYDTVGQALGRLNLPDEAAATEPEVAELGN